MIINIQVRIPKEWPWVVDTKNDFPSRVFKAGNVEITGNIYEGRRKK